MTTETKTQVRTQPPRKRVFFSCFSFVFFFLVFLWTSRRRNLTSVWGCKLLNHAGKKDPTTCCPDFILHSMEFHMRDFWSLSFVRVHVVFVLYLRVLVFTMLWKHLPLSFIWLTENTCDLGISAADAFFKGCSPTWRLDCKTSVFLVLRRWWR